MCALTAFMARMKVATLANYRDPPVGRERLLIMNRNGLYLVIGVLAVIIVIVGYQLYKEQQSGVSISIGEGGVSIEGK